MMSLSARAGAPGGLGASPIRSLIASRQLNAKAQADAKVREYAQGLHEVMVNGKWHCSVCGCPDEIAIGRRKGPLGDKTMCGECGKFYHRYRRPNDQVVYNTDPEYHLAKKKHTSTKKKYSGAAAARHAAAAAKASAAAAAVASRSTSVKGEDAGGARETPLSDDDDNDDEDEDDTPLASRARNAKAAVDLSDLSDEEDTVTPSSSGPPSKRLTNSQSRRGTPGRRGGPGRGRGAPSRLSVTSHLPLARSNASSPLSPLPPLPSAKEEPEPEERSIVSSGLTTGADQKPTSAVNATPASAQPSSPIAKIGIPTDGPQRPPVERSMSYASRGYIPDNVPLWLTNSLLDLRRDHPDTEVSPVQRKVDEMLVWRVKCWDCPGKVYNTGPDETLDNFLLHVKNNRHRKNVADRIKGRRTSGGSGADASASNAPGPSPIRASVAPPPSATLSSTAAADPQANSVVEEGEGPLPAAAENAATEV